MDDDALARRSVAGFAETLAALGATGVRGAGAVRTAAAVGARVPWAADNNWVDAAVVPLGAAPPAATDPALPHCLWVVDGTAAPGRRRLHHLAMPCLALELAPDAAFSPDGPTEAPPADVLGELNDRAYRQGAQLGPLLGALDDDRLTRCGVRVDGAWACVACCLRIGDDASIQYVATDAAHRRLGYARRVLLAMLAAAQATGARTATLQASPDGLPLYEQLGFRSVATLYPWVTA